MTYLSIDLDYWFRKDNFDDFSIFKLLDQIKHIPNKVLVDEHDELVPHINSTKTDKIIHIDCHQDICFPTNTSYYEHLDCHCGSFFYFIENRENIDFTWHYPDYHHCIQKELGFCMEQHYHPEAKKNWIFKSQKRTIKKISQKEIDQVTAVGIAFSFDYLDIRYGRHVAFFDVIRTFYDWFGKEKVDSIFHKYTGVNDLNWFSIRRHFNWRYE
jgi:hypothetical protein